MSWFEDLPGGSERGVVHVQHGPGVVGEEAAGLGVAVQLVPVTSAAEDQEQNAWTNGKDSAA